jgi:hypothetical protein
VKRPVLVRDRGEIARDRVGNHLHGEILVG